MRDFELFTNPDGTLIARYGDGRTVTINSDATQGYDFVVRYLGYMSSGYKNHLRAADLILRRQFAPSEYNALRSQPNVYNAHLAVTSMHCIFGALDNVPDCDKAGNLNVEFVACPMRATCPYNGYKHTDKALVCCNPIYELPLTRRQLQVADLLVSTSYTLDDIATALHLSTQSVRNHASAIYAAMGVANRSELQLLLKYKRII